jgi:hypothetical protein
MNADLSPYLNIVICILFGWKTGLLLRNEKSTAWMKIKITKTHPLASLRFCTCRCTDCSHTGTLGKIEHVINESSEINICIYRYSPNHMQF